MDQHTSHLPLDLWVHAVLKQSPEQIAEWENLFCKTALFMDPTVQNAVQSYLSADIRGYIYLHEPFRQAANGILKYFRALSEHNPFPIPDLLFYLNSPVYSEDSCVENQNPNIILTTQAVLDHVKTRRSNSKTKKQKRGNEAVHLTNGLQWTDVFSIFEIRPSSSDVSREQSVQSWCQRRAITRDQLINMTATEDLISCKV